MVGQRFTPVDLEKDTTFHVDSGLPSEMWTIVQSSPAVFPPSFFLEVSDNLLRNPNLTSSHLFRAEIFYDSEKDVSFNSTPSSSRDLSTFIKHMRAEFQPRVVVGGYPGYALVRTVVRKLIPRNPKLDKPLVQTCHLFTARREVAIQEKPGTETRQNHERYLIIYIPHVSEVTDLPWYHPPVKELAILYTWTQPPLRDDAPGNISLFYKLFPGTTIDTRLSRIALNMLRVIHKHSTGRMGGYTKRVHHDIIVTQKIFQDTYTFLKGKYAEILIKDWVEQTPATKHVFEDLGIAAFLIELWTDMYGGGPTSDESAEWRKELENVEGTEHDRRKARAHRKFPGFVDIGCGNGLLVYILRQEGWHGWGFDARKRKSWGTYPKDVQEKLKVRLLVPGILAAEDETDYINNLTTGDSSTVNSFPTSTDSYTGASVDSGDHHSSLYDESLGSMESLNFREFDIPIAEQCMISRIESPAPDTEQQISEEFLRRDSINLDGPSSDESPFHSHTDTRPDHPLEVRTHNGVFPEGTFLVANHADELTIWTPLLAYLSKSPFIAIPCCSHNFSGARFRAPISVQFKRDHDASEKRNPFKMLNHAAEGVVTPIKAFLRTVSTPTLPQAQTDGINESKIADNASDNTFNSARNDTISFNTRRESPFGDRMDLLNLIPLKKGPIAESHRTSSPTNSLDEIKKAKDSKGKGSSPTGDQHFSKPPLPPRRPSLEDLNSAATPSVSNPYSTTSPTTNKSTAPSSTTKSSKQPSAYASFCSYLTSLTSVLGYVPEKEILRIPSTRNVAILGRRFAGEGGVEKIGLEERVKVVRAVVEKEMGVGMESVRMEWLGRGEGLKKPGKGGGH